jgi:hypothetical protein
MPTVTPVIPSRSVVLIDPDTGADLATITATVVTVVRKEEPGILAGLASMSQKETNPRHGWLIGLEAQLQVAIANAHEPHTYFLSRLVGEQNWLQDAHFFPNGTVGFSHGFGARYLTKWGIGSELEALLDEAARLLGLVAEIGAEIPLVLADGGPAPA